MGGGTDHGFILKGIADKCGASLRVDTANEEAPSFCVVYLKTVRPRVGPWSGAVSRCYRRAPQLRKGLALVSADSSPVCLRHRPVALRGYLNITCSS